MRLLCLGGAKGGATVGLYQNGGYDYSGPAAHLGRSLAQLDRASAHLIQSAFRHMPIADQPIY